MAPRIYLGAHYPTDIIAGILIGAAISWLVMRLPCPQAAHRFVEQLERKRLGVLYALAFLFALSAATNFEDLRAIARAAVTLFGGETVFL